MATLKDLIYEDRNVYEAALDRIDKIYNSHDEVWVSFSGGKDSLAMLKLVEEYFDTNNYSDKINVVFRDEEVINTMVRDFVLTFVDTAETKLSLDCEFMSIISFDGAVKVIRMPAIIDPM